MTNSEKFFNIDVLKGRKSYESVSLGVCQVHMVYVQGIVGLGLRL